MNHIREKWNARAKSSSSSNDFVVDAAAAAAAAPAKKPPMQPRRAEVARRQLSTLDAQRFGALTAWMEQGGIPVSRSTPSSQVDAADAFDEMYESLQGLEATVESELGQLRALKATTPRQSPIRPEATRACAPLVDYFVVIAPDVTDLVLSNFWNGVDNVFEATVAFANPPQAQFNAESIEQFCFPRGIAATHAVESSSRGSPADFDFFVLVISGGGVQGQDVQYACCMRGNIRISTANGKRVDLVFPVCYCIVAAVPWITLFRDVLEYLCVAHDRELHQLSATELLSSVVPNSLAELIDNIMIKMLHLQLPLRGEEISIPISDGDLSRTFVLSRPRSEMGPTETAVHLVGWTIPILLSHMSIERVLRVIDLLFMEMKVVIVSGDLSALSSATLGFTALLYPLVWAGPVISVLPPSLHEYLEVMSEYAHPWGEQVELLLICGFVAYSLMLKAPVPILCGIDMLPLGFVLAKGTAVVSMDDNQLLLHSEDEARLIGMRSPGSSELARALSSFREAMNAKAGDIVVLAHVVARKIGRYIEDLLGICDRLGSRNARECIEKEQLTCAEALFIEAFMQSQMYQKYADDRPTQHVHEPEENDQDAGEDTMNPALTPTQPPQTETSIDWQADLRMLFTIAFTGVSDTSRSCPGDNQCSSPDRSEEFEFDDSVPLDVVSLLDEKLALTKADAIDAQDMSRGASAATIIVGSDRNVCQGHAEQSLPSLPSVEISERKQVTEKSTPPHPPQLDRSDSRASFSTPNSGSKAVHSTPPTPPRRFSLCAGMRSVSQDSAFFAEVIADPTHGNRKDITGGHCDARGSESAPPIIMPTTISRSTTQQPVDDFTHGARTCSESERDLTSNEDVALVIGEDNNESSRSASIVLIQQTLSATVIQRAWRMYKVSMELKIDTDNSDRLQMTYGDEGNEQRCGDSRDILRQGVKLSIMPSGLSTRVWIRTNEPGGSLEWETNGMSTRLLLGDIRLIEMKDEAFAIQTKFKSFSFGFPTNRRADIIGFFRLLEQSVMHRQIMRLEDTKSEHSCASCPVVANSSHTSQKSSGASTCGGSNGGSFLNQLRQDILVIKHGRRGKPHPKFLSCDPSGEYLVWKTPIMTNAGYELPSRLGRSDSRRQDKRIRVDSITGVAQGKSTRVFHRAAAGRSNAMLCFSILTPDRTLDIEACCENDYHFLYEGITKLMASRCTHQGGT